jgi:hypothetical protein
MINYTVEVVEDAGDSSALKKKIITPRGCVMKTLY